MSQEAKEGYVLPVKLVNWLEDRENEFVSGLVANPKKVGHGRVVWMTKTNAVWLSEYINNRLDTIADVEVWRMARRAVGRLNGTTPYVPALNA